MAAVVGGGVVGGVVVGGVVGGGVVVAAVVAVVGVIINYTQLCVYKVMETNHFYCKLQHQAS